MKEKKEQLTVNGKMEKADKLVVVAGLLVTVAETIISIIKATKD